jgi:hypothetical protein
LIVAVELQHQPTSDNGRGNAFSIRSLLLLILCVKLGIYLVIYLAYNILTFHTLLYEQNVVYADDRSISLATAFTTWDGTRYLHLASGGYHAGDNSDAFSPLLPLLVHVVGWVTGGNLLVAGFIVTNVVSTIAIVLFFVYTRSLFSQVIARDSVLFLLAFPTSFFFSLIYTESLLLCLTMLVFFSLNQKRYLWAGAASFFMPATRLVGTAILLPSLVRYVHDVALERGTRASTIRRPPERLRRPEGRRRQGTSLHRLEGTGRHVDGAQYDVASANADDALEEARLADGDSSKPAVSLFEAAALLAAPLLGFLATMVAMKLMTGDFFSQFIAQGHFIAGFSFSKVFQPWLAVKEFFNGPLEVNGYTNSLVDRGSFLFFLVMLVPIYRLRRPELLVVALVFGLLPVLAGSFQSYTRFLLVVFPLYIGLATLLSRERFTGIRIGLLYVMGLLQSLFLIMHALSYWVA